MCPYFKAREGNLIDCSSPMQAVRIRVAFSSPQDSKQYQCQVCKSDERSKGCVVALGHQMHSNET